MNFFFNHCTKASHNTTSNLLLYAFKKQLHLQLNQTMDIGKHGFISVRKVRLSYYSMQMMCHYLHRRVKGKTKISQSQH